jgi:hypothetical protein
MNTSFVEQDCTIELEGRKFTAGGAVVTPEYVIGYVKGDSLTDWHGNVIGTVRVLSSWPIHSYISSRMYSFALYVNDVRYVGRGCGEGMIVKGKRSKRQS